MDRVAIVTGANKGIGYEIVKALLTRFPGTVYLTARDEARGQRAVAALRDLGLRPEFHQLDVASRDSVAKLRDHIRERHGGIDVLVNNAAVANADLLYNPYHECKETLDINYFSLLTVQELLHPLLRDNARVVHMSSSCGHLSNVRNNYWAERLARKDVEVHDIDEFVNWFLDGVRRGTFDYAQIADGGTAAAYRVAKVAMSALTRVQQRQLDPRGIRVNSVHPGVVRTDMTRGGGFLSAEEAAATPVWVALDAPDDLRGAYVWFDRRLVDWADRALDCYFRVEELTQNPSKP